jgi:endonuclease G
MLTQIAGPDGLEALSASTMESTLERVEPASSDITRTDIQNALRKLETGAPLSPTEAFGLEAIVIPDKRPVVFIRNNVFAAVPMDEWVHLNKPEVHARLEPLFPSIGRIELPMTPNIPYGGTGFVVGPNLLMTNRHVARLFAEGVGTYLTYQPGSSAVDFKREDGTSETDTSALVKVTGVVMIHPYWDMALLTVDGLPVSAMPLKLSVQAPEELVGKDVVVVGYPARDYRNDLDLQDRIFEKKYGLKRMQPGKVQMRARIRSFESLVDAMTHDSSTLGGNSGSALIEVATGTIVGLHFAGEYLKANYAVPMYELARDSRVVNGVNLNFQGTVSFTDAWVGAWTRLDGSANPTAPKEEQKNTHVQSPVSALPPIPDGAVVTFTIPLHVTISVGTAVKVDAGASVVLTPTTDVLAEAEIEKVPVIYPNLELRTGYQKDFLEFPDGNAVPMPQLTVAGKAVAAKLDDGSLVLHYHKFSVVMHKKRRLALFTAANVDWRPEKRQIGVQKPSRKQLNGFTGNEREDWVTDPRIPLDHQLPDYFYTHDVGAFDRGHLVRRDDVAWGETFADMQKGNGDTFHTTNCSPQTAEFNQAKHGDTNWGALENMVQRETKAEKVCVFSGPVLDDDDRYFHGTVKSGVEVSIQIPSKFWKIIVANNGGEPAVFGFVIDQDLAEVDLHNEFVVPQVWKQYMRPISEIEKYLHGLAKLNWFKAWDQYEGE